MREYTRDAIKHFTSDIKKEIMGLCFMENLANEFNNNTLYILNRANAHRVAGNSTIQRLSWLRCYGVIELVAPG